MLAVALLTVAGAQSAYAQLPPVIGKAFGAATIPVGGSTSLTITITNPNAATPLSNVAYTDTLPAGLVVSTPNGLSTTCGGTSAAPAGGSTIGANTNTLAGSASCTLTVNVTGTSAGTKVNAVTVNSDQGTGNTATASITVGAGAAPVIAKVFGAASIPLNGSTSLSFTITNPNVASSLTNVAFTDTLPAGLVVSTPNGLAGSCGGGVITATAGSGSILLAGATLAGSASCSFSVNVTGTSAGTKVNAVTVNSDQGTGNTATASITVQSGSTTTLVSSRNPSSYGDPVTFTATVSGSSGTPTGTVTFKDGATTLGTVPLVAGTASFTTSTLTTGVHTISAVYSGDATYGPSSASLQQAVNVPADSIKLRQLQIMVTQLVAQSSGMALSGAIASAINDGFSDTPPFMVPSASGLHVNLTAGANVQTAEAAPPDVRAFTSDPARQRQRMDDAFAAFGYAPRVTKAPPVKPAEPRMWNAWLDLRGVFWDRNTFGSDIKGDQLNAITGVSARLTPDFLIGALAGYENFNFTSQALTGRLKGDGWTAGTYFGWRFAHGLRLDAGMAYSVLGYNGSAGTASGSFPGHRWLISGGVTGSYNFTTFVLEPSARVYALWEHEDSYTDSLGTLQADRNFLTGRASAGLKAGVPIAWTKAAMVTPYLGVYGDYYFSRDDGTIPGALTSIPLIQGWSARVGSGVAISLNGATQLSLDGELGGLGSDYLMWTIRARAFVPF
jgi:uncharacterized repeat protein (TIGR01451 family)